MHDAWFFIGVFVFIFLIWIITGGPLHPIAFTGPTLAQPQELGGGTYLSLPRAPFAIGSSNASLPGSSDDRSSIPTLAGNTAFGEPSPYRGLVTMTRGVSNSGSLDPRNESIEIRVSPSAGVPINLSEWALLSEVSGSRVTIPKGTEVPTSGVVNESEHIVLSPGDRAIIISGRSPIGASFRENKCIGYFSTFQSFSPALPQNCPAPSDELTSFYGSSYLRDTACVDFVNKLARCQVTLTPPVTGTSACQSFVVKYLNYNGCVEAHRGDRDFLGTTWRVYLGRSNSMWRPTHELVKLLDVTGKTVDAFSY